MFATCSKWSLHRGWKSWLYRIIAMSRSKTKEIGWRRNLHYVFQFHSIFINIHPVNFCQFLSIFTKSTKSYPFLSIFIPAFLCSVVHFKPLYPFSAIFTTNIQDSSWYYFHRDWHVPYLTAGMNDRPQDTSWSEAEWKSEGITDWATNQLTRVGVRTPESPMAEWDDVGNAVANNQVVDSRLLLPPNDDNCPDVHQKGDHCQGDVGI